MVRVAKKEGETGRNREVDKKDGGEGAGGGKGGDGIGQDFSVTEHELTCPVHTLHQTGGFSPCIASMQAVMHRRHKRGR